MCPHHSCRRHPWQQPDHRDDLERDQIVLALFLAALAVVGIGVAIGDRDLQARTAWNLREVGIRVHAPDTPGPDASDVALIDLLDRAVPSSADTVIIAQVSTSTDPRFHDVLGHPTPIIDFVTGGQVWVLRDGKVTPGRWQRANIDAPLDLTDDSGNPIGAKPGRTWIELLPAPKTPVFTHS